MCSRAFGRLFGGCPSCRGQRKPEGERQPAACLDHHYGQEREKVVQARRLDSETHGGQIASESVRVTVRLPYGSSVQGGVRTVHLVLQFGATVRTPQLGQQPRRLRANSLPAVAVHTYPALRLGGLHQRPQLGDGPCRLDLRQLGCSGIVGGLCALAGVGRRLLRARGVVSTPGRTTEYGGTLASPSTAYIYNWNMLPVGQQLWLKELESYVKFPPLQSPESYNLTQVMQQVKEMDKNMSK